MVVHILVLTKSLKTQDSSRPTQVIVQNTTFVFKVCAWCWIRFIFLWVKPPDRMMALINLAKKKQKDIQSSHSGGAAGRFRTDNFMHRLSGRKAKHYFHSCGLIHVLQCHVSMLVNRCHDQSDSKQYALLSASCATSSQQTWNNKTNYHVGAAFLWLMSGSSVYPELFAQQMINKHLHSARHHKKLKAVLGPPRILQSEEEKEPGTQAQGPVWEGPQRPRES